MRNSRQHPQQILTDQKTTGECGMFQLFGWRNDEQCKMWNQTQDCHGNGGIEQEDSFRQQTGLTFKNKKEGILHLERKLYGTKTQTLMNIDRKCLKSFQMWCWRRMEIGQTDSVKRINKYYVESRKKGTSCTKNKARLIRLVKSCVGTAF